MPKKIRPVKFFAFKDLTKEQMIDLINKEYNINLKYNEKLVNRIHDRYPNISKIEVSLIVKAFFESIRNLFLLGKVLNFNKLFFNAHFHFFDYRRFGRIFPSLRIILKTPPPIKKIGSEENE